MAMMAAGTPIALQAQGNGVTIVVNDGSQTANSISGVVYSEEDNEPLIGVQVRIVGANSNNHGCEWKIQFPVCIPERSETLLLLCRNGNLGCQGRP